MCYIICAMASRGRPKLPSDKEKNKVIRARVTTQEKETIARMAAEDGISESDWIRRRIFGAQELDEPSK